MPLQLPGFSRLLATFRVLRCPSAKCSLPLMSDVPTRPSRCGALRMQLCKAVGTKPSHGCAGWQIFLLWWWTHLPFSMATAWQAAHSTSCISSLLGNRPRIALRSPQVVTKSFALSQFPQHPGPVQKGRLFALIVAPPSFLASYNEVIVSHAQARLPRRPAMPLCQTRRHSAHLWSLCLHIHDQCRLTWVFKFAWGLKYAQLRF